MMDSELAGRVQVPKQDSCLVTAIVNSVWAEEVMEKLQDSSLGLCFIQDSQVLEGQAPSRKLQSLTPGRF